MMQTVLFLTAALAIGLTQHPNKELQRYACFFGIASQPAFFYEAYIADQWGLFALSFIYTGCWLMGLYHHWIKPSYTTEKLYTHKKVDNPVSLS